MSLFEQNKPTIRKKSDVITIGSETQNTSVQGHLSVDGQVRIISPVAVPGFLDKEKMKIFALDNRGLGWISHCPQSLTNQSGASGVDYIYIQTTRGFEEGNDWVLNPGANNMESGKVTFKLESKLFISGSGINSGLYYDHQKGERLINLTYSL